MPIRNSRRPLRLARLAFTMTASVGGLLAASFAAEKAATPPPPPQTADSIWDSKERPKFDLIPANPDGEGIVQLHGEPEGVAWLRQAPSISRLASWLWAGPRFPGEPPEPLEEIAGTKNASPLNNMARWRTPERAPEGPVSPDLAQLRDRMLQRLQGTSVPVMVAPLDSCKPVDVVEIQNLLFSDPAAAERIVQAAGQGFRVVILTPVADPNPTDEAHDCPRPQSMPGGPGEADHPQPTPVAIDSEGRVRITSPRRPGVKPAVPPQLDPLLSKLPGGRKLLQNPTAPRVPTLVPHPAPEPVTPPYVVTGPQPARSVGAGSPSEHLRLAAAQLAAQGFEDEARRIRTQAAELDRQTAGRIAAIEKELASLQSELERLRALGPALSTVQIDCKVLELDRQRMGSPEGVAFLRKHLGERFDEKAPLWPQVATAAASEAFVRDAAAALGCFKVLTRPRILTTMGRSATFHCGAEVPVPLSQDEVRLQQVGVSLSTTPSPLEGNRIRLELAPEVTTISGPSGRRLASGPPPGFVHRRIHSAVDLTLGQTAVLGGFLCNTPHASMQEFLQVSAEEPNPARGRYEILFLTTPVAPETVARGDSPPPAPSAADSEGRVRITSPRRPAAKLPVPPTPDPQLTKLPRTERPSRTLVPTPPAPGLLVPHPAPEPAGRTYVVTGPQPKSSARATTPSEHLRLAAALLEEQGFSEEARRIRTDASDLDRESHERIATIEKQITTLQSELTRLQAITLQPRQVSLTCRLVEVDRRRMSSPDGVALVRRHLGTEFDERGALWPQVAKAAASEPFLLAAAERKFLKTLDNPTMVTLLGDPCAVFCGGEVEQGEVAGHRRADGVGLSLIFTPERLEGDRLQTRFVFESTALQREPRGTVVPPLQFQRVGGKTEIAVGQTIVAGGLLSDRPHSAAAAAAIEQTAGEVSDPLSQNYEVLAIMTPAVVENAAFEGKAATPPAP